MILNGGPINFKPPMTRNIITYIENVALNFNKCDHVSNDPSNIWRLANKFSACSEVVLVARRSPKVT